MKANPFKFSTTFLFLIGFASVADASETLPPRLASPNILQRNGLPKCIDDPEVIALILKNLKLNKANAFKYDSFKTAVSSESDSDVAARLVYSETLAANCSDKSAAIVDMVASVVTNRIAKANGDARNVIFKLNQFASSLHDYPESRYKDFLCPKDEKLWKASRQAVVQKSKLPPHALNYFLYNHKKGWDKEPWSLPETKLSQESGLRDCIRVFENSKPRY